MDILREILKILIPAIVLIVIPILFLLIFDIGTHLGELFGRRR